MKKLIGAAVIIIIAVLAWLVWPTGDASAPDSSQQKSSEMSPGASTKPIFDKSRYSLTQPDSQWVIVNKTHPLNPKDYAPSDLTEVGNGQLMRKQAAEALLNMIQGAKSAGFSVTPASGYRSYKTQVKVYNSEVSAFGVAVADSESARPGFSEHQTGWAVDLASGGCSIANCFADTPGGKWITENAYKYGFILRYPQDLEAVTGYRYEPWHFRYVGVDLATEMHKTEIKTLELFFNLPAAPNYN